MRIEEKLSSFSRVICIIFLWCVRDSCIIKINSSPFSIKMGHPLVFPKFTLSNFHYDIILLRAFKYSCKIYWALKCANDTEIFGTDVISSTITAFRIFSRFFFFLVSYTPSAQRHHTPTPSCAFIHDGPQYLFTKLRFCSLIKLICNLPHSLKVYSLVGKFAEVSHV